MRSVEPAIVGPLGPVQVVDSPQGVQLPALPGRAHATILQVADRVMQVGDEGPLVGGRQEAGAVLPGALDQGPGADRDEAGQVLILGTQAVGHPGAQARPRGHPLARVHLEAAAGMVDVVRHHRPDDAQPVDARPDVREELARLEARLAVPTEPPGRGQQLPLLAQVKLGRGLAVVGGQPGLGVEGVDLRGTAGHEEEDHSPGTAREMGRVGR